MNRSIFSFVIILAFLISQACAQQSFWKSVGLGNTFSPHFAVNSEGTMFASTFGDGIFRSTDEGFSWTQLSVGLGFPFFTHITIASNNDIYVGGVIGLFRSTDNGNTWGIAVFPNPETNDIMVTPNGSIYAATYSGIHRSTDRGVSWVSSSSGLPEATVISLAYDTLGNLFAGLGLKGVFISTDAGEHWLPRQTGIEREVVYDIGLDPQDHLYIATLSGVFKSTDSGTSWTSSSSGMTNKLAYSLGVERDGTLYVGTLGGGVFISKNAGQSWDSLNTNLGIRHVMSIAIFGGSVVYIGTNTGGAYRLAKGSDSNTAPVLLSPSDHDNRVATAPTLAWERMIVADEYKVQVSLDSLFQRDIVAEIITPNLSFTPSQLDHSRRYHWRVSGINKYWTTVPSIAYSFQTIDPSTFSLDQNYPNPFNLSATIKFSVPYASTINLNLYTVMGQRVATLLSQLVQPGDHRVSLDASQLSSGTYIYTLQAEEYFGVRKFTIVK